MSQPAHEPCDCGQCEWCYEKSQMDDKYWEAKAHDRDVDALLDRESR